VTEADARSFQICARVGGVALFPTDTVYGLACDPESRQAVGRLYALKGRPVARPAAVMFFAPDAALAALPELGQRGRAALERLLPGAVTVLLPNLERRFPLACASDPGTLGLRVPSVAGALAPLASMTTPVLQSSANRSGGPDARRLDRVPAEIRNGADLVLDGGELPGIPSTVVDLRTYEDDGTWAIVREGAITAAAIEAALSA